jgi:hypothetical protein
MFVAHVRSEVSEERIGSIIVFLCSVLRLLVTANVVPNSPILALWRWRLYVPPKRQFLQEQLCVTSQKTAFFVVTAVKTSNLTCKYFIYSDFFTYTWVSCLLIHTNLITFICILTEIQKDITQLHSKTRVIFKIDLCMNETHITFR